jgi:SulP family sulfate permease
MRLLKLYRREFRGYGMGLFWKDLLAGLTVAAVALPLALAFGQASGATPAAGIVTAILGGVIIALFSGAPYGISGPTGAMSAVLIVLATRYGLPGVWAAGVLAGAMVMLLGIARLGKFVAFIPSPVITGFTIGIALIIAIGQIDNFLGVTTPAHEGALLKLAGYFQGGYMPNPYAVGTAMIVIVTMIVWPRITTRIPGSLIGIIIASVLAVAFAWPVADIGAIPRTIVLADRLTLGDLFEADWGGLLAPAFAIAVLGAIESLLAGAVAGNMTGVRMDNDQELIAQGIGNLLIPFFGGVPATAAIARVSVAIKSGGQTRMVSIIHGIALLIAALAFAPIIARIPLAALAGVLMVTAWRMNEWHAIQFFIRHRFKGAIAAMVATALATVTLDLSQAILIGIVLSAMLFMRQISDLSISRQEVDLERLKQRGIMIAQSCPRIAVYYIGGPLFFGAVRSFLLTMEQSRPHDTVILSMRGVPMLDVMGVQAIAELESRLRAGGGSLYLSGLSDNVRRYLDRAGITARLARGHVAWSAEEAIVHAQAEHHRHGCPDCSPVSIGQPAAI